MEDHVAESTEIMQKKRASCLLSDQVTKAKNSEINKILSLQFFHHQ